MDIFLHLLWGFTIARWFFPKNRKVWFWGIFLGALPDLLGAGPWIYYRNIVKVYNIYQIPEWAVNVYNSTHNLFTAGLVFLIIYFTARKYLSLGLAYLFHVILDIPVHCEPIGIKIFFPLLNWSYCSPLYKVTQGPSSSAWSYGLILTEVIQYLLLLSLNIYLSLKKID